MKTLSRNMIAVFALAGLVGLVACEQQQDEAGEMTDPLTEEPGLDEDVGLGDEGLGDEPGTADVKEIDLDAVQGSNVTGTATITPLGDQIEVALRLEGADETGQYKAHIHNGSCGDDQGVAVPLNDPIASGGTVESTTTIERSQLTGTDAGHFVQAHAADGTPIACADLPEIEQGAGEAGEWMDTGETTETGTDVSQP